MAELSSRLAARATYLTCLWFAYGLHPDLSRARDLISSDIVEASRRRATTMLLNSMSETKDTRAAIAQATAFLRSALGTD